MTKLTGHCLCGKITFEADTDIKLMANCHCSDCRAATGAAYGTLVFVPESGLKIKGTPKVFMHKADSGSDMEKLFCPDCGSQMFGRNSARAGMIAIRAGVIDQKDVVKPTVNVFLDSKLPSTPVDPALKGFARMPG
jgi:hypothetical protein